MNESLYSSCDTHPDLGLNAAVQNCGLPVAGVTTCLPVVLVSDDIGLLNGLKLELKRHGFLNIQLAADEGRGYALVLKTRPFIVLIGIFDRRISSFQLCERIRGDSRIAKIPLVLLSRSLNWEERFLTTGCGANELLPVTAPISLLQKKLWEYSRNHPAPASPEQGNQPEKGSSGSGDNTGVFELPALPEPQFEIDLLGKTG